MQISNGQVRDAFEAVQQLKKRAMPLEQAFAVRELARELQQRVTDIEELRNQALEMFGKKDDGGNLATREGRVIFPTPDAAQAFERHYAELLAIQCDVSHTLKLGELGEGEITPEILWGLGDLLIRE